MEVETFECRETVREPIEASREALEIIESLGLEGQREIVNGEEGERSPYREMRADELFAYSVLCPTKVEATRYSAAPIPLRVLQVLAHAKSLGIFSLIQIWDKTSAAIEDPIAIGVIGPEWNGKRYMLARWGDELDTFETMLKKAADIKRRALVADGAKARVRFEGQLAALTEWSDEDIISCGANARVSIDLPEPRNGGSLLPF